MPDEASGHPHARTVRIAYFVHDLSDPAAGRRVEMLRLGGAEVRVIGFHRSTPAPKALSGAPTFDLGRTYDSRLLHRALVAGRWMAGAAQLIEAAGKPDVILARNLEMLGVASAVRARLRRRPPLIYECLDIHRVMLARGLVGAALRTAERWLMRQASAVLVSSPAFLSAYFEPRQGIGEPGAPQALLVENKVLAAAPAATLPSRPAGPPWRILWPGVIRCRRSLEMLKALAQRRPDLLEVTIRGRPTPVIFPDLGAELEGLKSIRFGGPFTESERAALYREAHFTWAVDYFDDGMNSDWLLPNRLYESGYFGSVPIARAGVEMGRWLRRHGLGVTLDDPGTQLEAFLDGLTPGAYARLEAASLTAPRSLFYADPASCESFVEGLERAHAA